MREVFTQRTKITLLEGHGMPAGVPRKSRETILESVSTAIRVFGNQIGISRVTLKSKINTEAPFPRAVGTDMRLCLNIT